MRKFYVEGEGTMIHLGREICCSTSVGTFYLGTDAFVRLFKFGPWLYDWIMSVNSALSRRHTLPPSIFPERRLRTVHEFQLRVVKVHVRWCNCGCIDDSVRFELGLLPGGGMLSLENRSFRVSWTSQHRVG